MIIFVDDEKWFIQGILDYFEDRASRINNRYHSMHFFNAEEAIRFIESNTSKIDLIITDIAMDYGNRDLSMEIMGGVLLTNELKTKKLTKHIPIIILSMHTPEYFKGDLIHPIDGKSIFYINRSEDMDNNLLYPLVDIIINN